MTLYKSGDSVKRSYRSPRREQQATETKRTILEAAISLMETLGYQETTIKSVAERADVSEQTVYNAFGDKVGLLCGVAEYAMSPDGSDEAELLDALRSEPDPTRRIRMVARYSRERWQEGAVELDLMLSAPDVRDPRLLAVAARVQAFKFEMNLAVSRTLFPDSIRRPDVSVEDIAALATAVDSGATVTALMRMGWDMDDFEDWMARMLMVYLDPAQAAGVS